jgi:hypothetical protein
MQNNLKSNWMGHSSAAPTLYRASSNGNALTRTEKLRSIFAQKKAQENKNARMEMILKERNKAHEETAKRERFFRGVSVLTENPDAKVRHGKNTLFIQPRVKGSFGPKVEI